MSTTDGLQTASLTESDNYVNENGDKGLVLDGS